ncbi:MAG: FMN-binding protein [Clostridia bacterium]|nr:FMN-binding protein [Clostridia bacterium]
MKKQLPAFLVLLLITLIAGLILGGTFQITKDPIEQQALLAAENARKAALPQADAFQAIRSVTADGVLSNASAQGKVGPVAVSVLMDQEGTIQSLTIGDENYAETPEYAAAVQEDAFISQFIGKKAPFALSSGNAPAAGDAHTASSKGFAGPVAVQVAFDDAGVISSFTIGDDQFAETEGYGKKALEPAFAQQFVGKKLPLKLSDIDAISGATVTSTAVVNAANKAFTAANAAPIDAVTGATVTSEAVVNAVNSAAASDTGMDWCYAGLKEGQIVGYVAQTTIQGFGGPVEVISGITNDKTITGISVGGSNFSETAGLGAKAKDDAFTGQFAGKSAKTAIGVKKAGETKGANDIDAITAATITSSKVTGGVNDIATYVNQLIDAQPKASVKMEKPEVTFTASSKGYGGPVDAEVGFDDDGSIVYLAVGQSERFAESEGFGARAREADFVSQFVGLIPPVTIDDIDALSGATITTEAVISAVNKAYDKSQADSAATAPAATAAPAVDLNGVFSASSKGYGGPVEVKATFDDNGQILTMEIGGSRFAESDGFGSRALEPAFAQQFVGKCAPVSIGDIDALSGATVTTDAVISALNKAWNKRVEAALAPAAEETAEPADVPVTGAVITSSSKGYNGPVAVSVTFDAEGKITSLSIGNEKFAETQGVGDKALDPAFAQQFIGKQAPVNMGDIDAISGATVTTEAVVNAINKAYSKVTGQ